MTYFNNVHDTKYQKVQISNMNLNVDTNVIKIENESLPNNTSSKETNINDIAIPDLNNICQITAKQKIEYNGIINITDRTIENTVNEISQLEASKSSTIECMPCDTKVISRSSVPEKPIDTIITISDDSDEEEIKQKPSVEDSFVYSNTTFKRKFNNILDLNNHKKTVVDINISRPNTSFFDKQRFSHYSQSYNTEHKDAPTNQQLISSSNVPRVTIRKLRPIAIDGLNIGHKYGCGTFSAKGIDLCVQFFAKRGHKDILVFIPEHRQGPPGSDSHTILSRLKKLGQICFTPSRKVQNIRMTCYDDRILLNYAHKCGGVVVSNDYFRDLYDESEEFKHIIQNRQVMVTFARDEIIVPEDQYNRKNDVRSLSDILSFPVDE